MPVTTPAMEAGKVFGRAANHQICQWFSLGGSFVVITGLVYHGGFSGYGRQGFNRKSWWQHSR
jgi:hypothetical protein